MVQLASNGKSSDKIEQFWRCYFTQTRLSLITKDECVDSEVAVEESEKFLEALVESDSGVGGAADAGRSRGEEEEVEDLLDLM